MFQPHLVMTEDNLNGNVDSLSDSFQQKMKKIHYENYELWIKNFSLNLQNIWNENSAKDLFLGKKENLSAIVIGRGPSIDKKRHLEMIANSNYKGCIICCDGKLVDALKSGVIPKKFPNYYVITIDPGSHIQKLYHNPLVDEFGPKIKGVFPTIADPNSVESARKSGIKIHWFHSLFDYNEGKKSFNYISAVMVRAKNDRGLPALQTGGNVGTSAWFFSWKILGCSTVALIGINHGWDEDDPIELITRHGVENLSVKLDKNSPSFKRMFPKIYNPQLKKYCILDPIFQYYRTALIEFISRSPQWLTTINATEGGSIFGNRITCGTLREFLEQYN